MRSGSQPLALSAAKWKHLRGQGIAEEAGRRPVPPLLTLELTGAG